MNRDDAIFALVAFGAFVALFLATRQPKPIRLVYPEQTTPADDLTFNQINWGFVPPVANILPQKAIGINGIPTAETTMNNLDDCGCYA